MKGGIDGLDFISTEGTQTARGLKNDSSKIFFHVRNTSRGFAFYSEDQSR